MLKHKFYKSSPRTALLMLAALLLAAGLSSCSQADSQSDFEPITPPPLEIPPVDPPLVPESGTDVTAPPPDFYSPLPTEPATGSATPSPYGAFGVTPAAPVPSSPNSTIPFSTGQPVIPQPSSGIQVTPQSPVQSAPAAPVPTAPIPTAVPTAPIPVVPSTVPNVAPPLSNATPGTPNGVNSGMYMPPPASTF